MAAAILEPQYPKPPTNRFSTCIAIVVAGDLGLISICATGPSPLDLACRYCRCRVSVVRRHENDPSAQRATFYAASPPFVSVRSPAGIGTWKRSRHMPNIGSSLSLPMHVPKFCPPYALIPRSSLERNERPPVDISPLRHRGSGRSPDGEEGRAGQGIAVVPVQGPSTFSGTQGGSSPRTGTANDQN